MQHDLLDIKQQIQNDYTLCRYGYQFVNYHECGTDFLFRTHMERSFSELTPAFKVVVSTETLQCECKGHFVLTELFPSLL